MSHEIVASPLPKIAKVVILNNKQASFSCNDPILTKKLHNFLSYKIKGVEWTQAYQNGWNGITHLMSKKGLFASGLVPKVKQFLVENDAQIIEQDHRQAIISYPEIDLTERLKELKLEPRDYQQEIIAACLNNRKGIVRACTGSGKTICTAILTAKLNKPTIIHVIGLDLLQQFHDLFSAIFDEPIGFIGNGVCQIERINIASIWTIARALKVDKKNIIADDESSNDEKYNEDQAFKIVKMLQDTKLHILDESHTATTQTIDAIYKAIDPEHIFGFSGTPFRDDGSDLLINGILGDQIINISASRLIKAGYLAQPIIKFVAVPKLHGVDTSSYPSVYKDYVVENEVRNKLIVDSVLTLLEKKYTPLVLFKQIKHGNILLDLMLEAGIKCEMLYGNDSLDKRNEVKQMLVNKEIDVILASTIYDVGLNLVDLNSLVLCGSGKSSVKTLQRIGRVLRGDKGNKFSPVVDFYDNIKYLKNHSNIRLNTYEMEDGFKTIKCQGMK